MRRSVTRAALAARSAARTVDATLVVSIVPRASSSPLPARSSSAGTTPGWSCGMSRSSTRRSPASSTPLPCEARVGPTSPPKRTTNLPGLISPANRSSTGAILSTPSATTAPRATESVSTRPNASTAGRAGASPGCPVERRAAGRVRPVLRAVATLCRLDAGVLEIDRAAQGLDRIHDAADDGVDRLLLGHVREARAGAGGHEHELADPRTDRVGGHDPVARGLHLGVDFAGQEELQAHEARILPRRADGAHNLRQDHAAQAPLLDSERPMGSASSSIGCGRGMTCTEITSPTLAAAVDPASVAARTAATSPRTIVVT